MLELNINQAFFANHGVSRTENPKVIFQNGTTHDFTWCPSPTEEVLIAKLPIHTVEHAQVEDFSKILIDNLCMWVGGGGEVVIEQNQMSWPNDLSQRGKNYL